MLLNFVAVWFNSDLVGTRSVAHATCTWLTTHKLAGLYVLRLLSAGDCNGGPMMVQLPLPAPTLAMVQPVAMVQRLLRATTAAVCLPEDLVSVPLVVHCESLGCF